MWTEVVIFLVWVTHAKVVEQGCVLESKHCWKSWGHVHKRAESIYCRAGTCFLPCFIIQGKSSTGFRRHNQTTAVSLTEAAMTKREVLHVLTTSVRSWILRHGRIRTDILSFCLFRHHWLESLASGKRITLVLISLSIKWG